MSHSHEVLPVISADQFSRVTGKTSAVGKNGRSTIVSTMEGTLCSDITKNIISENKAKQGGKPATEILQPDCEIKLTSHSLQSSWRFITLYLWNSLSGWS